jgi:MFS family permease
MHGLYLLWWVQEKQVPPALVATILAAGDLALTVLEVPTGWLADRCGHRISLIAGSLVQVAGMLVCWLGGGVAGLVSASVLVALGDAFRSGADQALLYRSCVALDREVAFQKIEAKSRAVQLVALVGLTLAGGAIVEVWGFAIGWLVEASVCGIGLAVACAMVEPPTHARTIASNASVIAQHLTTAPSAFEDSPPRPPSQSFLGELGGLGGNRTLTALMTLVVPASLMGGAAAAMSFLFQTTGGSDAGRMTVLVAIVTLAEAAGSAVAAHIQPRRQNQVILASVAGAVLAAAAVVPAALLPAVVMLSFLLGVAQPLRAAAIQHLTADGVRARAASIASACDHACATAALMAAGWVRRRR